MENKRPLKLKLLPTYFKLIGLAFIVLGFTAGPIIKLIHLQLQQPGKELMGLFSKLLIILGMYIIAWSKDKNEYEGLMGLRLKSFISAFFFGVFWVTIKPLGEVLISGSEEHISGAYIIGFVLFFYLFTYYWDKLVRNRKRKIETASTE
jgi:hypothetical protein